MKLRSKINLYTSVMFICLLIVINGAIYLSFSSMMERSELVRAEAEAAKTSKGINEAEASITPNTLLRAYVPINGMLQIVTPDGKVIAAVTAPDQQDLRDQPITYNGRDIQKIIEYKGITYAFVSIPVIWTAGQVAELQMTKNLEPTENILKTLKLVLILVTLVATVPVLLSIRLLSNFIIQPITSLINTMREIQKSGQFKRIPLPKESKNELFQLGDTFNDMMDLLETNYEKQEQFVSNASHELKTPLTVIKAYAELLKRRGNTEPKLFDESVEAIHSEAIRMIEMTQELLMLARHDEKWKVEIETISLSELIEASVISFREGFKREINLIREQQVTVKTDPNKLKQLFYILMENAHKYSSESIKVIVRTDQRNAVIEIIDRGIGIPGSELEKVFDRFFRVDEARTRKSGGFGLGLPLAKDIANAIGAEIRLDSVEGQGTTAKILLKLVNSH
ncbi:sensor histidine kinase [Lederbergia wuyishanensis]|uniref:histidine kinase n=1 Tax=Lederbergia wuyishanensis TaxID=1347903 RepID=A0ABU0D498_9BACI|nr:HAMP domain-containing sensor histidine kinase [Lederbergia wuyishanensis]MCJ8008175.1 HAMP domain-containing histidine kinase [Lederbergia wuyishanensis]MDQ0343236.1 signal transduction histidine kinase [Lederbergia wuyishanensis]